MSRNETQKVVHSRQCKPLPIVCIKSADVSSGLNTTTSYNLKQAGRNIILSWRVQLGTLHNVCCEARILYVLLED